MKASIIIDIEETKKLIIADKYNSRMNKRTTFRPETKACTVRLMQSGLNTMWLAHQLGLNDGLLSSWKTLYRDFDLTNDTGFADFLGMFDGRQMKHKASQRRSNYMETRRVNEAPRRVTVEVQVTSEPSVLDTLTAKLKEHQAEVERLTKQIELVKMAEELDLQVKFK